MFVGSTHSASLARMSDRSGSHCSKAKAAASTWARRGPRSMRPGRRPHSSQARPGKTPLPPRLLPATTQGCSERLNLVPVTDSYGTDSKGRMRRMSLRCGRLLSGLISRPDSPPTHTPTSAMTFLRLWQGWRCRRLPDRRSGLGPRRRQAGADGEPAAAERRGRDHGGDGAERLGLRGHGPAAAGEARSQVERPRLLRAKRCTILRCYDDDC